MPARPPRTAKAQAAKKGAVPTHQANPAAFFTPAEVAAAKQAKATASVRTPREVLDSFSPLPLKIGGLEVRPVNLATTMLLERLGNALAEEGISEESEISLSDSMQACYLITHDEVASSRLLAEGRAVFDEAVLSFAATIPYTEIHAVVQALARTFAIAFATMMGGQKKTTPTPSTRPSATASAGS